MSAPARASARRSAEEGDGAEEMAPGPPPAAAPTAMRAWPAPAAAGDIATTVTLGREAEASEGSAEAEELGALAAPPPVASENAATATSALASQILTSPSAPPLTKAPESTGYQVTHVVAKR